MASAKVSAAEQFTIVLILLTFSADFGEGFRNPRVGVICNRSNSNNSNNSSFCEEVKFSNVSTAASRGSSYRGSSYRGGRGKSKCSGSSGYYYVNTSMTSPLFLTHTSLRAMSLDFFSTSFLFSAVGS
ncbi:hypothetical protein SUGI_0303370 [Cryptomeria japonica]|nr:hypothetical protein SUGI_0303370 [Cryptomeria japonica]